jgi:hypothetical protein
MIMLRSVMKTEQSGEHTPAGSVCLLSGPNARSYPGIIPGTGTCASRQLSPELSHASFCSRKLNIRAVQNDQLFPSGPAGFSKNLLNKNPVPASEYGLLSLPEYTAVKHLLFTV